MISGAASIHHHALGRAEGNGGGQGKPHPFGIILLTFTGGTRRAVLTAATVVRP
jgi:hypothetical protein